MESTTRNPLLSHLRDLKPNRLYSLVDARTMKAALADFTDGAVRSFSWEENGTILAAEIARPNISVETRLVHLALDDGRLLAQCTCPFSPTCRHVTVTLMTIARLLRGAQFTAATIRREAEWAILLGQLEGGDATPGGLVSGLSAGTPKNAIPLLAVPVHDAQFTLAPATRDPFAPEAPRHVLLGKSKAVSEEDFQTWWPAAGTAGSYALAVLMEGANRVPVEPGEIAPARAGMEFRTEKGKVTISCFLEFPDGRRETHLVRLGEHLVFLPKTRRLVWLENPLGWALFEGMPSFADIRDRRPGIRSASFRPRIALQLPLDEFNRSGFALRTRKGVPEPLPPEIVMAPDPGKKLPRVALLPEIEIEIDPALGDITLYPRLFAADGTEFSHIAAVLHAMLNASDLLPYRDRYDASLSVLAYQIVWSILLSENEAEADAFTENLSTHPGLEDEMEVAAVIDFAETVLSEFEDPDGADAELVALGNTRGNPWGYLLSPLAAAARTAAVLGSVLEDAGSWDIWHRSIFFRGETEGILGRLGLLLEKCQAHGITLKYQALPVSGGALDFKVSAERPPGNHASIDWFELKPEVTCDGFEIPPERWNELLTGNLFHVSKDGGVRLLTLDSVETLARLRDAYERSTGRSLAGEDGKKRDDADTFTVPRLQILDWIALARTGVKLELPPEEKAVLDALVSFEKMRVVPMPATVQATLRPYQDQGFQWLAFLYEHRFGACLADDMGLGKTIQTITLLAAIRDGTVRRVGEKASPVRTPHLIVLPPTLVFNWESEIARFAPHLSVLVYTGSARKKLDFTGADVILTTYELVRRDLDDLKERQFDIVIFDEAQAVKNDRGERSKAARQLPARFRLCLTGTPMENHVGEYFSIIELALPGLLGDRKRFIREANQDAECPQLCRARPFVLRRTKEKILKELPAKVESNIHLDLTKRQKEIYSRTVAAVREEVAAAFADKAEQQAGIVALAALTRLRQVCISPALLDPDYNETAPKLEYLATQLAEITAEGHAALVFSQFTRALDTFEHALRENALPFQRLDGKTKSDDRRRLVGEFQDGSGPGIFLISLKTGGAGLNLTRASYVFHLDPWWNPAVENQASDRAHRIGQTQTVFVTRLLMRHTIEEKMMELKARKQEIYDQIVNQSAAPATTKKGGAITREDMAFLLGT